MEKLVGVALSQRSAAEGVENEKPADADAVAQKELFVRAQRQRLPDERASTTHKFSVGGSEGYITVGMYEDGRPGEVFIKMSKEGSTLSGVMDGLALTLSIGLQYGVPLKVLVNKIINTRFEPSGFTENPEIRFATSLLDYVGRWLGGKFISRSYLNSHLGNVKSMPGAPSAFSELPPSPSQSYSQR